MAPSQIIHGIGRLPVRCIREGRPALALNSAIPPGSSAAVRRPGQTRLRLRNREATAAHLDADPGVRYRTAARFR